MEKRFYISIAELNIEMNYLRARTRLACADYEISEPERVDIVAATSEEKIAQEIAIAEDPVRRSDAEQLSLFRDIAEAAPNFGSFLMHGAAIEYGGKGYLFTALSGTGKTTHINLWMKHLGDKIQIINGDKPLLRVREDGVDICSTPWAGKERMQRNCIVPMGGLCILQRGTTNQIQQVTPSDYLPLIIQQVYLPHNVQGLDKVFTLLNEMLQKVPVYLLYCDMSEEAVKTSFPALTGEAYPNK